MGSLPKKSPMKKSGASSSAMSGKGFKSAEVLPCLAKASNRLCTSRTVEAAATTTKGETRVDQALEVEAAKTKTKIF